MQAMFYVICRLKWTSPDVSRMLCRCGLPGVNYAMLFSVTVSACLASRSIVSAGITIYRFIFRLSPLDLRNCFSVIACQELTFACLHLAV